MLTRQQRGVRFRGAGRPRAKSKVAIPLRAYHEAPSARFESRSAKRV